MDASSVRYIKTEDGVRIAYWRIGRGSVIIQLPALPYSHIEFEWTMPELRRGYELLALRRSLIRYDGRGTGLSDREANDFKLSTLLLDLEAVVQASGAPSVALIAALNAAPVAVLYATTRPGRVSHLLLWTPNVQPTLNSADRRMEALWELLRTDFHLYSETVSHAFLGWQNPDASRQFAEFIRTSITAENALQFFDDLYATHDVVHLLPQVSCPTLVMHRPAFTFSTPGAVEDTAARISHCQIALFEGDSAVPYLGDWRAVARTVYGFLGETEPSLREEMGGRALTLIAGPNMSLSERERDVIELVVRGWTNRQIAEALYLSEKTVENHVGRILTKLDLPSRAGLAAYAVEHGLSRKTA